MLIFYGRGKSLEDVLGNKYYAGRTILARMKRLNCSIRVNGLFW